MTVTTMTGEMLRARYVVGADGMHSVVREQAGVAFSGDSYPQSFVLAGDAAHVHSPAGGQGMNTGIQDATELARRILEGTEDGYEAVRRPVAAGVLAMTDRMTRAATVRGPVARAVRDTVLAVAGHNGAVRQKLAMSLSELSVDR